MKQKDPYVGCSMLGIVEVLHLDIQFGQTNSSTLLVLGQTEDKETRIPSLSMSMWTYPFWIFQRILFQYQQHKSPSLNYEEAVALVTSMKWPTNARGAMPNRPKNKNCPVTMKFGGIVGRAFIKM